jgi:hypothetical protein
MLLRSNSARFEYTYTSILIWTDYTIHTFYLCLPYTIFCSQLLVPIQLRRSLNLSVPQVIPKFSNVNTILHNINLVATEIFLKSMKSHKCLTLSVSLHAVAYIHSPI